MRLRKMNKIKYALLASLLMLSACNKDVALHGFNFEHVDFGEIKVNETSRNAVLATLGSPTSQSDFNGKTDYYIESKVEKVAFLDPKVLEQRVLAISYNQSGIVSGITEYTLDDANKVIFSDSHTELKGNGITPVQQIMTNLGKYNKNTKRK